MKRIALAALLFPCVAHAQTIPDMAGRLRKEYDNCVYAAVGVQWKAQPKIDPSTAAEMAFQSCLTEEQGLRALLLNGTTIPPPQIEAAVVGIKLTLKRTVREIMADPSAYLRKQGAR